MPIGPKVSKSQSRGVVGVLAEAVTEVTRLSVSAGKSPGGHAAGEIRALTIACRGNGEDGVMPRRAVL